MRGGAEVGRTEAPHIAMMDQLDFVDMHIWTVGAQMIPSIATMSELSGKKGIKTNL